MKDKSPILILFVLFVLVGLAYGPYKRNVQNSTSSSSQSSIANQNTYDGSLGYTPNKYTSEDLKEVEEQIKNLEKNLDEQKGLGKASPYADLVSLSYITNLNNPDPSREYIRLSTYLKKDQTLNITGWYLRSEKTGYTVVVGKTSLLPFPFSKTSEENVVLQYQDKALLIKGFSPIGISFRTNKCTGYFEQYMDFFPDLQNDCPRVIDTELPQFSTILDRNDECVDMLTRIRRCESVTGQFLRDLPDTITPSCKAYAETHATYNACVATHFSDIDFPGDTYYIYFNKFGPLWRSKNEKINLYDKNGLVVDSIEY